LPDRVTHVSHALEFIKLYRLRVDPQVIFDIENIIDNPYTVKTRVIRSLHTCNDAMISKMIETVKLGLKYSNAFRHDWGLNRARRGRIPLLLKSIIECLYGSDAKLLVDLHSSLDMIVQRGFKPVDYIEWARSNSVEDPVIEYVLNRIYGGLNKSMT